MIIQECQHILEEYIKWIRDNTKIKSIKDGSICSISTPFLDNHNDHLQIYAIKKDDKIILTDDGYTLTDLEMSGVEMNTQKRQQILHTILNGFGARINDEDELCVEATHQNIGQKKHYLIQAILAVNDMYTMSQENVYSLFKEDVERYFKREEIIYTKDVKLTGKSGFDHNIDFIIPAGKTKPERLLKTINKPKKDYVKSAIFTFSDIREARQDPTHNYIIYNDVDGNAPSDVSSALKTYNITPVRWSERNQMKEEFTLA